MMFDTPEAVQIGRAQCPVARSNQNDKRSVLERFMNGLVFDASDCWYWRGSHTNLGYGIFSALGENRSHRVAWRLWHGDIPKGMHVLHRCDVRCCVNPEHLFLGTHSDNMRDMVSKGRGKPPRLRGDHSPVRKLNSGQVSEIRDLYATGSLSQRQLADQYGVGQMTINRVIRKISWCSK